MEIEGCGYNDEMSEIGYAIRDNTAYSKELVSSSLYHLLKGYSMQGWGNISNAVKPMDVSGKVSVDIKWGGDKGPTASVGASASASDDNGNSVSVAVSQNSDGNGSATISVEHKEDDKK